MPLYDYRCANGHERKDLLVSNFGAATGYKPPCETCGAPMDRLPSAPSSFTVEGYSAKNGYSK